MNPTDPGAGRHYAPLESKARVITEPFQEFVNAQTASGWVLLLATATAILFANSAWGHHYYEFLHIYLGAEIGDARYGMSIQHWVNDGLMALFFFLLGLELKRELLVGQLRDMKRASAVLCAAAGGIMLPAAIFLLIADSAVVREGWAIPVATDTAFALMILVLLGDRIPTAARAFLVGLAIVDDLGAILVIAVAYTTGLDTTELLPASLLIGVLLVLNLTGVRKGLPFFVTGIFLWMCFVRLGLHGTLAGVVVALAAPVRPAISRIAFVRQTKDKLQRFEDKHSEETESILEQPEQQEIAQDVVEAAEKVGTPLTHWETRLEKPISFVVMPLFAFMNAGVALSVTDITLAWSSELGWAIALGLMLGKPGGILAGVWIGKMAGIADLPGSLSWSHIIGLGLLGSIGFTMSLLIGALSFGDSPELLLIAKQSIIMTSFLAGLAGYAWLRYMCPRQLSR